MASLFSIGNPFIELKQVESTNNYATGLAHEGMAQHGTAVFAHDQTKGKGQRHKAWQSEAGRNIALSVIIQPQGLAITQGFLMSMAVALGVYRFFSNYAGAETKIKWPNDIYWRDRKAAGILIENIIQGVDWRWCIAGIGININQTSFHGLEITATSLKQITGKDFEPLALAKELCQFLEVAYTELKHAEEIVERYNAVLYKQDEVVHFRKGPILFSGTVKEVTRAGRLVVDTGQMQESFEVGEIDWVQ